MSDTISKDRSRIYTVSDLTANIKNLIEENFPFVWISGEISNFRTPSSGHFYFTLKDDNSQISAVIFRGQRKNLKFQLEDGLSVTGLGRVSVYEPRGTYQLIFEYLEPEGLGALQAAFEQLKQRLLAEGLFDERYKLPLPFLPNKISIITSKSGAVVHDIIKIISRRFPNIVIEILPVKVQGEGAERDIVTAIEWLNIGGGADVAILARGGGSLEDLQAFNSEEVARAVFAAKIPIISAIGHEVDYTIADFVADVRAPTPSAAAELVVPVKDELKIRCDDLSNRLKKTFYLYIEQRSEIIKQFSKRLTHPKRRLEDLRLRVDDVFSRLIQSATNILLHNRERYNWRVERLHADNPVQQIEKLYEKLDIAIYNLFNLINLYLNRKQGLLREQIAKLYALSPHAILERGYSITRTIPESRVVTDPNSVVVGQMLNVKVLKGTIICRIERKSKNV